LELQDLISIAREAGEALARDFGKKEPFEEQDERVTEFSFVSRFRMPGSAGLCRLTC
jgi:hypothetical protein